MEKRPTVIRIIGRLNVGGPARHVVWLTSELGPRGYDSFLVTGSVPRTEGDMSYFAAARGVRPYVIPELSRELSLRDLGVIWKLYRLFRRLRPAIVHTHTAKAGAVGRLAALLYNWLGGRTCRIVHTYHGHIFHGYYGRWKSRLFLAVERFLARVATDRLVVLSPQQYREIHKTYGVGRPEQFVTIPLGLDFRPLVGASSAKDNLRRAWGADEADLLVGMVGRLTEVKNPRMFLQAAALCLRREDRKRLRFVVVGDGHLRRELESQARQLGIENVVTFLGFVKEPEDYYPVLDIVALTSLNEGTPLSLLEAMAAGTPVVATGVGGVVDILGGVAESYESRCPYVVCERGIRTPPNDPEAFSAGLLRLVGDESLRRTLAANSRQYVQRCHSLDRLVSRISELYRELLSQTKRR